MSVETPCSRSAQGILEKVSVRQLRANSIALSQVVFCPVHHLLKILLLFGLHLAPPSWMREGAQVKAVQAVADDAVDALNAGYRDVSAN